MLVSDDHISIEFICARYVNPDKILEQASKDLGIDFITEKDVNSDHFVSILKSYQCDVFVSMSFNQILRPVVFEMPKLGTINCHAGKLPEYRGRNILNWALINDEKEFGITVHYIDRGVDTGDIILQRLYEITDADDYGTLLGRAYEECPRVLYDAITLVRNGNAPRIKQSEIKSYGLICSQRLEGDELINWDWTSREIFNFVRGLKEPGPIARSFAEGVEVYIEHVELIKDAPCYKCINGAILAKCDDGFLVKTGDSYLKLKSWSSRIKLRVGLRLG